MRLDPYHSRDMRILFMGTPDFAVPSLEALCAHSAPGMLWPSGLDIIGVVTRPDKPVGRGKQVALSPVKRFALENEMPVYQPGSLRKPESLRLLRSLSPNLIVVAAFGQILPPEVLSLPTYGSLNVHASLLPRWRGASPITAAILAGDRQTGVTIMEMDEGLDTGSIVTQRAIQIGDDETAGELSDRLAVLGGQALTDVLPLWLARGIEPAPQDESLATTTGLLKKSDGRLDWSRPAEELARQVRAFTPWPGAFTTWEGKQLKVLRAHPLDMRVDLAPGTTFTGVPGEAAETLASATSEAALALDVIQLEGKRALPAAEVLHGHPALAHAVLGA